MQLIEHQGHQVNMVQNVDENWGGWIGMKWPTGSAYVLVQAMKLLVMRAPPRWEALLGIQAQKMIEKIPGYHSLGLLWSDYNFRSTNTDIVVNRYTACMLMATSEWICAWLSVIWTLGSRLVIANILPTTDSVSWLTYLRKAEECWWPLSWVQSLCK